MTAKYLEITCTDSVLKAQSRYYGKSRPPVKGSGNDAFTGHEIEFIESRDSFYMATVSETGWPYLQHRGGTAGFLQVTGASTLVFPDYEGNRQLLSTGNLAANDRIALFLMDYPQRARLKILGRARVMDAGSHPELAALFVDAQLRRAVRRLVQVDAIAFDWNCPQYITPRYTAAEVEKAVAPLRQRIAELEARMAITTGGPAM